MVDARSIRVLLVDDHPLMRKGIRSVLAPYEDSTIVGEASNGLEVVNLSNVLKPSGIIMTSTCHRWMGSSDAPD